MRNLLLSTALAVTAVCPAFAEVDRSAVVQNYGDIALAGYEDSLSTARDLREAIGTFLDNPSELNLRAAKDAWLVARIPYQQTEAFRFGNPSVDDWEGKVNAWPLDEGLIDYTDGDHGLNDENPLASANVIANPMLEVGGAKVDASKITPEVLEELHEIEGIEANVATGYHAIEFLLWGQDLNGTGPGAGMRPATDYDMDNCTGGNCDRRADYLVAAADLLISDLEDAVALWSEGGQARTDLDEGDALSMAFTGLGSLSFGEQAGERMKLGLLLHDPEESHDCFSDNSAISHYYDGLGIRNVYTGRYVRIDGSIVEGPSLEDVVAESDADLAHNLRHDLNETMMSLAALKTTQEAGVHYDELLAAGNEAGNALVQEAIDGLVAQTRNIARAAEVVGVEAITIEGSDSLGGDFK